MWQRVFGSNDVVIGPEVLLERLQEDPDYRSAKFHGDDQGWFRAEIVFDSEAEPVTIEHFQTSEEGIRQQLNTWAAWLEENAADPGPLMQRIIGTTQVFVIAAPPGSTGLLELCKFLAERTAGIIQVDGAGFFDAAGVYLAREEP